MADNEPLLKAISDITIKSPSMLKEDWFTNTLGKCGELPERRIQELFDSHKALVIDAANAVRNEAVRLVKENGTIKSHNTVSDDKRDSGRPNSSLRGQVAHALGWTQSLTKGETIMVDAIVAVFESYIATTKPEKLDMRKREHRDLHPDDFHHYRKGFNEGVEATIANLTKGLK